MRYVSSRRWQVDYFDFSSGFDFGNMTSQVVELGNTPLFSAAQQPRPTVTTEGVLFFSPELVCNHTKIQGNTGGSFFFSRMEWRPDQNAGTYRRV